MRLDSQGYPQIIMGDPLPGPGSPKSRTLKRIVIGFTGTVENPNEVWPRMEVQVRHEDRWCSTGIAVVFRDAPGTSPPHPKQVYPELCMHGDGKIRATLALNPEAAYEPTLSLRGKGSPPAQVYTVTSRGPATKRSAPKKRA